LEKYVDVYSDLRSLEIKDVLEKLFYGVV